MKNNKQLFITIRIAIIILMMVIFQSCFQDLGQNPPFDYPEQPELPPLGPNGQMFYMDFDDNFEEPQSLSEATVIGSPGFAKGIKGNAYAGAKDSYLTFSTSALAAQLSPTMTFSFWYKVNNEPDRAGILVIGPKDKDQPADKQNNRSTGLRIFRENAGGKQSLKANIGNGEKGITVSTSKENHLETDEPTWKFITLVLMNGKATLYIDAVEIDSQEVTVSWKDCDIMSIGSGAPRFTGWNHWSDHSLIDELRIYTEALTAAEVKAKFESK